MATVALSGIITPTNVVTATSTTTLSNKTLVAPALGTPVSGNLSNCTGIPAGSAATPTALGTVYGKQTTSGGTPYLTAYGYNAGLNTTGTYNIAVGVSALQANTTGFENAAVGYQALFTNTTAGYNTAVGYKALYAANKTSDTFGLNTAIGHTAGEAITTAAANVIVGARAATSVTTSGNCIFIGPDAGNFTTPTVAGSNSIFIGVNTCGASASPQHELVFAAKNAVGKGNATCFIQPDGGGVYQGNNSASWSTTSDRRLKKNIVDNTVGLDAITSIRVRNFEYRLPEEITELPTHSAIDKAGVQLGVIAQELQAVLPDCVKQESTGVMSVDSDNLFWYAINAIKELKAQNDSLKARLDAANL
jgi:hypothetical protein